jgi:tetratricopeptide (TPR) repeat protein
MGVHQFMLGRELPCTVVDLLEIRLMPLPGATHDALVQQVEAGRAYPDVLYRLGLSHFGRQELGLARQRLTAAVAQKPDYSPARLALAAVCDLLAQHAEAVDHLDAVLSSDKSGPAGSIADAPRTTHYDLLCAVGFCLERLGTPGTAVFRYQQALASEPTNLFAHHRLAAIYLAQNQLEQAVEHHRAILNAEPQEQAVRTSLAHMLQLLGRHKEAVWEYEKALCLDPDNWDLQLELADQFERMGNSDAAIHRLRSLCEKNPQFPDLHLRLANLYSTRGDDSGAMREFGEALTVHPDYLDCHIATARHELKMGRTEQAIKHFQRAIAINNQNVEAYAGLAVALNRLGKADQSKEMLAAAWKVGHNSDVLVAQLGQLELQAEAAQSVESAFDPNQQDSPATDDREHQRQWLETQIDRYESLLAEHPTWTDVRVRYGMLLKLMGRWQEAADAFENATRQNPSYVEAWVQLALALRETGDVAGAMRALETAIQVKPEYADLHYRLGLIYCSEMEFDLAMERMEDAVALNSKNPDFQRHLWVVLQGLQMSGRRRRSPELDERTHELTDEVLDRSE